jgi:hypothetical protein
LFFRLFAGEFFLAFTFRLDLVAIAGLNALMQQGRHRAYLNETASKDWAKY